MVACGGMWCHMMAYGAIWWHMVTHCDIWQWMYIYGDIWWYMGIYDVVWWYMMMYGDIWCYMVLYGDIWWLMVTWIYMRSGLEYADSIWDPYLTLIWDLNKPSWLMLIPDMYHGSSAITITCLLQKITVICQSTNYCFYPCNIHCLLPFAWLWLEGKIPLINTNTNMALSGMIYCHTDMVYKAL